MEKGCRPTGEAASPGKRKKGRRDTAEKLLEGAVEPALQLLIDTMNDPEEKNTLRLECAKDLLARVYGRTPEPLAGRGEKNAEKKGEGIVLALSEELRKLSE